MFTGIVDHTGEILKKIPRGDGISLWIRSRFSDLTLGESISVDGTCLTVHETPSQGIFECLISPETLNLTTIESYEIGTLVNLERAMQLSDRMGGHWVTGHVDQRLEISDRRDGDGFFILSFKGILPSLRPMVTKKGCAAINGVSLTINECSDNGFEVMIIPHTAERTNLKRLKPNALVNFETDWLAKLVIQRTDALMKERAQHE